MLRSVWCALAAAAAATVVGVGGTGANTTDADDVFGPHVTLPNATLPATADVTPTAQTPSPAAVALAIKVVVAVPNCERMSPSEVALNLDALATKLGLHYSAQSKLKKGKALVDPAKSTGACQLTSSLRRWRREAAQADYFAANYVFYANVTADQAAAANATAQAAVGQLDFTVAFVVGGAPATASAAAAAAATTSGTTASGAATTVAIAPAKDSEDFFDANWRLLVILAACAAAITCVLCCQGRDCGRRKGDAAGAGAGASGVIVADNAHYYPGSMTTSASQWVSSSDFAPMQQGAAAAAGADRRNDSQRGGELYPLAQQRASQSSVDNLLGGLNMSAFDGGLESAHNTPQPDEGYIIAGGADGASPRKNSTSSLVSSRSTRSAESAVSVSAPSSTSRSPSAASSRPKLEEEEEDSDDETMFGFSTATSPGSFKKVQRAGSFKSASGGGGGEVLVDRRNSEGPTPFAASVAAAQFTGGSDSEADDEEGRDSVSPLPRKRSLSVSISNMESHVWIQLEEDELAEIDTVLAEMEGGFTLNELRRIYADYKFNGKKIDKGEFSVIFATYSWSSESEGLVEHAYAMADPGGTGNLGFGVFMKFLKILKKGKKEDKTIFCFNLFDGSMDPAWTGTLARPALVKMIAGFPLRSRRRKEQNLSMANDHINRGADDSELGIIREEDEGPDAVAAHEAKLAKPKIVYAGGAFGAAMNAAKDRNLGGGEAKGAPSKASLRIATDIVAQAYADLDKRDFENLDVQDFHRLVSRSNVSEFFVPL